MNTKNFITLAIFFVVFIVVGSIALAAEKINIYGMGKKIATYQDGELQYYHRDMIGSTSMITDGQGEIVTQIDYLAFGEPILPVDDSSKKDLFLGKEQDVESGLYYMDARFYDAKNGIFSQVDGINNPLTSNYVYSLNNPISYADPSGMNPEYYGPPEPGQTWDDFQAEQEYYADYYDEYENYFETFGYISPEEMFQRNMELDYRGNLGLTPILQHSPARMLGFLAADCVEGVECGVEFKAKTPKFTDGFEVKIELTDGHIKVGRFVKSGSIKAKGSVDANTGEGKAEISGSMGPVSFNGNSIKIGPSYGVQFGKNAEISIFARMELGIPDGQFFASDADALRIETIKWLNKH
jgi:RHS repeat-associated protein